MSSSSFRTGLRAPAVSSCGRRVFFLALATLWVAPGPSAAQGLPGSVATRVLPTGSELWVLSMPGSEAVVLDLVFTAGTAVPGIDPSALEPPGLCAGGAPTIRPGPDYQVLGLRGDLPAVLSCLSSLRTPPAESGEGGASPREDANPASIPPAEVDDPRGGPALTAVGALLEALYGPGGLDPDPASSIATAGPTHVVLVGDVEVDSAAGAVAAALRLPGPPTGPGRSERTGAAPVGTEVLLLDRPGVPLVELQVGELLLPGDHPDWPALVVGRELLARRLSGSGPTGAWAYVELIRLRGTGAFLAGSRLPASAAPEAVSALMEAVSALRDRLLPADLVAEVVDSVGRDFAAAVRSADGAAAQLARVAGMGLEPESLQSYPVRLAAIGPETVRRAVRTHLDPSSFVIVAAGDAASLATGLATFGPVRRVDTPEPPDSWPRLVVDGRTLPAAVLTYRVRVGTREVGRAVRTVAPHPPDSVEFTSVAELGDARAEQTNTGMLPGLEFGSGTSRGPGARGGRLRREGDRLVGTLPGGGRVDLALPRGTVVADLLEPSLWAARLEPGDRYRVPVTARDGSSVRWAGVQVAGPDTVTVPAGTFETLRVEVTGPESMTLWVLPGSPHLTVRLAAPSGVVLELESGLPPRPEGSGEPPFRP